MTEKRFEKYDMDRLDREDNKLHFKLSMWTFRIVLFPIFLMVRLFRWVYYMD